VYLSVPGAPAIPTLTSPTNGATNTSVRPTLTWSAAEDADFYTVSLATDSNFTDLILQEFDLEVTSYTVPFDLDNSETYHWNVKAYNEMGEEYSNTWSFTTELNVEDAGPNGGDANDDGTLDSEQANVTSF